MTASKKVWVEMLDSESHRFEPGGSAVHLRKGQRLQVSKKLAVVWCDRIGLAKRVKAPAKGKATTKTTEEEGGGEG